METGNTRQDMKALFEAIGRINETLVRYEGFFGRLYCDPKLPGAGGDIPDILRQQREINVRCLDHARCLAEDRAAIQALRMERRRWMRNAKWALWLAVGGGGGSAVWVAIRDFLLGR